MRKLFLLPAIFLLACGARGALGVDGNGTGGASASTAATTTTAGSGGAAAAQAAIRNDCAPADGPAIRLFVTPPVMCPGALDGLSFFIWGIDVANIQPGTTLTIGMGLNATTSASVTMPKGELVATGGTLTFTAYVHGQSAAGSYAVTFTDGSTQHGTFTAIWCKGPSLCG